LRKDAGVTSNIARYVGRWSLGPWSGVPGPGVPGPRSFRAEDLGPFIPKSAAESQAGAIAEYHFVVPALAGPQFRDAINVDEVSSRLVASAVIGGSVSLLASGSFNESWSGQR
jgi:hypothetical protein